MGNFTDNLNKKSNHKNMQQKVNIDISKTTLAKCECGNPYYEQVIIFREVNGLLVGQAGKNVHQPFPVMVCRECKKPHSTSLPYLQENQIAKEKPQTETIN